MKYVENLKLTTTVEDKSDLIVLDHYNTALQRLLGSSGVWLIRAKTWKVSLSEIVSYLFNLGFDVFDLILLSRNNYKLFVCTIDSRRIQNSVVFALKAEEDDRL